MRFRKKPVVIEAERVTEYNQDTIAAWCGGAVKGMSLPYSERVIAIQTLEGEMQAKVGDWIICGVKGEFYPCKPDIFEATYEKVED
jgi:hypothetical protein